MWPRSRAAAPWNWIDVDRLLRRLGCEQLRHRGQLGDRRPRRSRRPWPRLARAAASPRFASPSRRAGARPPGTHATPYRRHAAPPYGRSPPPALPAPCRSRRRRRSAERRSASASRPGSRRRPHRAPPRRAPRRRRAESADRVWRNEVEMPSAEADRVARDDEGCQPSRAGTRRRTREHRVDVRLRSIRDPLLDARQAPAAPVALCDEADRRDIRAGLGSVSAKAETASPGTKAGTHRWITPPCVRIGCVPRAWSANAVSASGDSVASASRIPDSSTADVLPSSGRTGSSNPCSPSARTSGRFTRPGSPACASGASTSRAIARRSRVTAAAPIAETRYLVRYQG